MGRAAAARGHRTRAVVASDCSGGSGLLVSHKADASLTGVAGLSSFGVFCRKRGIDAELARLFFRLKSSPMVIYPMETQLRLLLDANVAGEHRVFGLESLVPAPLFVRLAGGVDMRDSPSGDLTGPVVRRQAYVITRAGRTWVLGMCAV